MIEVRGVSQTVGGRALLEGVFLRVDAGQVVLIGGASGCGKTILLELLAARRFAEAGSIFIFERDVSRLRDSSRARLRRRVQFVSDRPQFLDDETALANCALPLEIAGISRGECSERARAAMTSVGLMAVADAPAGSLSAGERRLLSLSRALISGPDAVVIDEPSAGMTPRDARRVVEVLDSERWSGLAIICASNDPTLHGAAERHSWRHFELTRGDLEPVVSDVAVPGQILPFPDMRRVSGIRGAL